MKIAVIYVEVSCAMALLSRVDWNSFDFCDLSRGGLERLPARLTLVQVEVVLLPASAVAVVQQYL